jgi:nicotinate-nucleotide adenylyltransferase
MIGILGGTFDPVHFGHLRIALEAYEKHKLKEVRFIPVNTPVHKHAPLASSEHRLKMVNAAIKSQEGFIADNREIKRQSPSYMIETLLDLHAEMPHEKFGLILGSEQLVSFTTWHRWEEILKLATLIVMPRETSNALPISSTEIREMLQSHLSPRYLLPDDILDYITKHKLYSAL